MKVNFFKGEALEKGGTSITGKESPSVRGLVNSGMLEPMDRVLDFGAGKHGRNSVYLREHGISVYSYDPYHGTDVDGWTGVSNVYPTEEFDVALTSYVLNVVTEREETKIIKQLGMISRRQIHITRNKDIFPSIKNSIEKRTPLIESYITKEYDQNYSGTMSESDIHKLIDFGVQTSRGFQRLPHLESKGFELMKDTFGYKLYSNENS